MSSTESRTIGDFKGHTRIVKGLFNTNSDSVRKLLASTLLVKYNVKKK
jgi:hypothetical protein